MKTKTTSFLTSDTRSSFLHFFRMSDNSYSLNVLQSGCLSTWDWSWLLTVYLFSWNLKMIYKSPYKYKRLSLISNSFHLERSYYVRGWSKQKVEIIVFHFSYRPRDMDCFIYPSLNIMYGFRLDGSEIRLRYTHIQLSFTVFIQKWNDSNYLS